MPVRGRLEPFCFVFPGGEDDEEMEGSCKGILAVLVVLAGLAGRIMRACWNVPGRPLEVGGRRFFLRHFPPCALVFPLKFCVAGTDGLG